MKPTNKFVVPPSGGLRVNRSPRDRILDTATALFYKQGIHAVGVDTIVARSGVAKMTLYKYFKSKEGLISAVLCRLHHEALAAFLTALDRKAAAPRDQLLAVFDVLAESLACQSCRGCPFVNATVELADPKHPGHQFAREHQAAMLAHLKELATSAGLRQPAVLAQQILQVLLQGRRTIAAQIDQSPAFPPPRLSRRQVAEARVAQCRYAVKVKPKTLTKTWDHHGTVTYFLISRIGGTRDYRSVPFFT